MNDTRELERQHWRYRITGQGEGRLARKLDDEIGRLVTELRADDNLLADFRQVTLASANEAQAGAVALATLDEALTTARRQLAGRDYAGTLSQIKTAHAAWQTLRLGLEASATCAIAQRHVAELQAMLPTTLMQRLATPQAAANLLAGAQKSLRRGQYRQAQIVAQWCQAQTEVLMRLTPDSEATFRALLARLERLRAICHRTQNFIATPMDDPRADGTLTALRQLLEGQRLTLATHLLDDLEAALAARRAFLIEYERQAGGRDGQAPVSVAELQTIIAANGWEAATAQMLQAPVNHLRASWQALRQAISYD